MPGTCRFTISASFTAIRTPPAADHELAGRRAHGGGRGKSQATGPQRGGDEHVSCLVRAVLPFRRHSRRSAPRRLLTMSWLEGERMVEVAENRKLQDRNAVAMNMFH